MSRIKEHYHEQIVEGIRQMTEKTSDDEYQYKLFKENEKLEKLAEEEKYMSSIYNGVR